MSTLTLHGIDDAVITAIRNRAAGRSRTVEAEAADILVQAVGLSLPAAGRWDDVERIAAMTPCDVRQTDSVEMLREDRGEG